jgi:hypothetical protein
LTRTPGSVRGAAGNGGPYRDPWLRCPSCQAWSERQAWSDAPGRSFRIVCPLCGVHADVGDPPYRLYDPTKGIQLTSTPPDARAP